MVRSYKNLNYVFKKLNFTLHNFLINNCNSIIQCLVRYKYFIVFYSILLYYSLTLVYLQSTFNLFKIL